MRKMSKSVVKFLQVLPFCHPEATKPKDLFFKKERKNEILRLRSE
jgi:hypothetical protein